MNKSNSSRLTKNQLIQLLLNQQPPKPTPRSKWIKEEPPKPTPRRIKYTSIPFPRKSVNSSTN